jgi:hypothetical protein
VKLCDKCFAGVEANAEFCPECGAPTADGQVSEGSDAVVYPEIARANLYRMRGNQDEAQKVCLAILRRYPNNPSAHIMLGDIEHELGRTEEAKRWYEMALDLTPENESLKQKLQRTLDDLARETQRAATASIEVPAGGQKLIYALGIAIVLAVAAAAFWLGSMRANHDKRLDVIEPISVNGVAPPKSEAPTPSGSPPIEPPSTERKSPPGLTSSEQELMTAMASDLGARAERLLAITELPKSQSALATVLGSSVPGDDAMDCAQVGASALARSSLLLRADVRVLDPDKKEVRFSASVTRDSLAAAKAPVGSVEWAASVLTDVANSQTSVPR